MPTDTLKEKTVRGLSFGLLNNGAMQVLNLVFGIVLANILRPEEYGLAGELAIFSNIAAALQEGGFISALTNRRHASRLDFVSVFWFNVGVSLAIYVLLWFAAPLIAQAFGEPELLWLSRYAFVGFVIASLSITPRAILFRRLKVKEQTVISVVALLSSGLVGIAMALSGMSYWSIVTQSIIYVGIVALLSWRFARFRPTSRFSWQPIREMFGFSFKIVLTNVFNCINRSIFVPILGYYYTKLEVGIYTQADKWNTMGSQLVTGVVQGVSQPMFVQVGDDPERLRRAFRKMLRFTALVAFPAMLGLALVAPQLILVTVGTKWLPSANIMRMLCLAGAFMPVAALYFNFLISRGRSAVYMWNIMAQGLILTLLLCAVQALHWSVSLFGHTLSGIPLMVALFVATHILWIFLWHYFAWREIRLPLLAALLDLLPFLLCALLSMALAWWASTPVDSPLAVLLIRIPVAAATYALLLYLSGAQIFREALSYLRRKS